MSGERRLDRTAWILIGVAVCVRAVAVHAARFTGDESFFWATARNIATFEASATYGPSLTGSGAYHPGPLFFYLMAIPQRLGSSPLIGGTFVALLHGLAGLLLFLTAQQAFGRRASYLALVLFAFAPWDVLYADRIWLSCVAPVWGTVILYTAACALDRKAGQAALGFFAVTLPQLHMSAPIIWTAALILILLRPPAKWRFGALGIGVLLGALTYAAPLYNELTHDFVNTRAILREGGGKETLAGILSAPFRVFGYAALYASGEIGYHFQTGYWRPFQEAAYYFSLEGWAAWFRFHGLWSPINLIAILTALFGNAWAAVIILRRGLVALRTRSRASLELGDRMVLALLGALLAAAALLMLSKKSYYPHYTNMLMPLALLPLAMIFERIFERTKSRAWVAPLWVAIVVLSMASSTVRYYRDVDRLNGLDATLSMVEQVIGGPMPVSIQFDGFYNRFAWEMLANYKHHQALRSDGLSAARFRIHNASAFGGEAPPPGATLHGAVLLEQLP